MIPVILEQGDYEIICPSIPGYGFSDAPQRQGNNTVYLNVPFVNLYISGFNTLETARIFKKLMNILGYKKFYAQGGDWGSLITGLMAAIYPESVYGVHVNMASPNFGFKLSTLKYYLSTIFPRFFLDEIDMTKRNFPSLFLDILLETGYFHLQATKPDTVGIGLQDSPAGLAGYIVEKFSTWTNNSYKDLYDGGLTKKFTLDEILTNIMIYWSTGTITSSMRFYKETISNTRLQKIWRQ